jgi:hypothetical protein
MHLIFVVVLLCIARAAGAEGPVPTVLGPALDLTHPFDADTIYWPTEEPSRTWRRSIGFRRPVPR